ncbi:cadherin-like and PC-esterase domain-containing protein 1 [Lingula anatina]|uniref:Cadherin-like and PC-esterase domain-containing protein 1 n=1 Tax=Lingula anatina TaxID=7574 RepID=A0A1S3JLG9_LINAN|nr:cadherin-like and PC-esterase domain-containing protein 1 [Lingula anatina]XP_013411219.1 cadherin-like and PC-esterase domain-containing protein 1 [Lingula anatina]XP_013411220.1 cadherin-like and PC-esterase domain-containing protein 1 [Lingula anatina]XP_013411221.1 cadherin-like and PC-esterase domain-containing protein 1 [Lingula anatina]XP_013411222.1 cadherin-like and PC-esterase domain-containing protein 1 [Lingula anatina]XP_013411224.1 cadherin-like and PC-esterase domain-containi|eukprot:XP_013411217.1 cadherin-like and PC-esterase domain-containing protein 1 [Lingula anatina]
MLRCRWRLGSQAMREMFGVILLLASLSVLITYQISKGLLQKTSDGVLELQIQVDQRFHELRRVLHTSRHGEGGSAGAPAEVVPGENVTFNSGTLGRRLRLYRQDGIQRQITPLYRKLKKLEDVYLDRLGRREKVALVRGSSVAVLRDLPLYEQVLKGHGFSVRKPVWYERQQGEKVQEGHGGKEEDGGSATVGMGVRDDWLVLLCLSFTDGDNGYCLRREEYRKLYNYQKVNRIPGVRGTLWRKDALCNTMNAVSNIPDLKTTQLYLPCYVMPAQYSQYIQDIVKSTEPDVRWIYKPNTPGGGVEVVSTENKVDLLRFKTTEGVLQRLFENPLLLFGSPFNVRVYVAVTSVAPLRAYVYSEGLVQYRQDAKNNFKKVPNRSWFLTQLRHYLTHNFGKEAATVAFHNMESVVLQTLLLAESTLVAHFSGFSQDSHSRPYRCQNCYQLLAFDVIFNSTFYPAVVEVNGQPDMQEGHEGGNNWASNVVKRGAADELLSMLFSRTSVVDDVVRAVKELDSNIGIVDVSCQSWHKFCLTEQDLIYMMDTRREYMNKGNYHQLYPSPSADVYMPLLHSIQKNSLGSRLRTAYPGLSENAPERVHRHPTAELHDVIMRMEHFYHNPESLEDSYDDLNVPVKDEIKLTATEDIQLIKNVYVKPNGKLGITTEEECSEDEELKPYMSAIHTDPPIKLQPSFRATSTEYQATVPYNVLLVKVWATARSCDCEVRLQDTYGPSRPMNYTLGIGSNRVTFHVVDIGHSEPWVINSYTLTIYRESRSERVQESKMGDQQAACQLQQDCDLGLAPDQPCGVQTSAYTSWDTFQQHRAQLPHCHTGDNTGVWYIPCGQCNDENSCDWSQAVWQPDTCRHHIIPRGEVKQCLSKKKLMFIGDSTNRGMMHYIMEQINGSLSEWDKTHNIKVYSNINNNSTMVSFAYYPQFWLPTARRPVFEKALYQLFKRSEAIDNSSSTVLVVGGVQWLGAHHLSVLKNFLDREGWTGIQVIIKGLGSGFHLKVEGLMCLSLEEQRKQVKHNEELMESAKSLGYDVVDTFAMTVSRFKEFLQGRCACHFHRVTEIRDRRKRQTGQGISSPIRYHVEGEINTAYSEILINRMCDKRR